MNTPIKFEHEKRPDFQFERSDYRTQYEDLAAQTLSAIVRHKGLIISLIALALALACILIPMMPRKYSAEALIYPNLFSREQGKGEQEKVVALASLDAAAVVTGEARLLRSDAFLRTVAKHLGQSAEITTSHSWATRRLDWVRATLLPETRNHSPFDRTVAMLRNKVAVMNDTRSYLISVSFTAASPDEAARVVNAFAIQYLRDKAVQRGLDRVNSAAAELQRQLAVYGDKHPKALHAGAELDAARTAFEAEMKSQDDDRDQITGDQSIKLAVPSQTPTSPNGFIILGLFFLSGLLAGIGLAVWLDGRESKRIHNVVHQTHPR
jgi:uncharacterized protein involved in exopolysaccharide biosynthesis